MDFPSTFSLLQRGQNVIALTESSVLQSFNVSSPLTAFPASTMTYPYQISVNMLTWLQCRHPEWYLNNFCWYWRNCCDAFEDTKGVIRLRKSKDIQHNDQQKKDKKTNNNLVFIILSSIVACGNHINIQLFCYFF